MKEYISKIKNEEIRKMTQLAVDKFPPYFYTVSSSSTSKYHPYFAQGLGGLHRHVVMCLEIALSSFVVMDNYDDLDKDIVLSALMLHDGVKRGLVETPHSTKSHPIDMGNLLKDLWKDFNNTYKDIIINCVMAHSGQWNEKGLLPVPKTKLERFVHYVDFISSRKDLWDKYINLTKGENND